jgi:hypothetical protein
VLLLSNVITNTCLLTHASINPGTTAYDKLVVKMSSKSNHNMSWAKIIARRSEKFAQYLGHIVDKRYTISDEDEDEYEDRSSSMIDVGRSLADTHTRQLVSQATM